jgi:hypothetical protein
MYALHSRMGELDYAIEPEVECLDKDPSDVAFVRPTTTIRVVMLSKSMLRARFIH